MPFLICKKCGGNLFLDEDELACLQCGARSEMPAVARRRPAVDSQAPPTAGPAAQFPDIPWIAPRYIRFTSDQIIFLLIHLEMLRAGHYPRDPKTSGYVDSPVVQTGIQRTSAYFTKSVELAAEIDSRLACCGLDRYLVEDYYCRSIPEEDLARHLDMEVSKIRRCIKSAVSYISSGPCPRWRNCLDCGEYQSCHYKKHVGTTYKNWKRTRNRRKTLFENPLGLSQPHLRRARLSEILLGETEGIV